MQAVTRSKLDSDGSATSSVVAFVLLGLFALPFAGIGLMADLSLIRLGYDDVRMLWWDEVPCTILAAKLEEVPDTEDVSYRVTTIGNMSDGWVDRDKTSNVAVSAAVRVQASDTLAWTLSSDYGDRSPSRYFGTPLINGRVDEAPSIVCDGLPTRKVVLDSEHLSFKLTARDDFGVKRVGVEWQGEEQGEESSAVHGE